MRAKDQTYEALGLYESMNVKSVCGECRVSCRWASICKHTEQGNKRTWRQMIGLFLVPKEGTAEWALHSHLT